MRSEDFNSRLPVPLEQYRISPRESQPESSVFRVPLSHYLWILRRHVWKVVAGVAACMLMTLIISVRSRPVYESVATIDIDRQLPTGVIGPDALRPSINDTDQFLATQTRLIQSDSVLRPVVERFGLEAFGPKPKAPESREAPVKLPGLKVSRPANTYLLLINFRSTDSHQAADVANAIAQSYLEHTYKIRYRSSVVLSEFMERQLEELKAKMEASTAALLRFERELNVINPAEKTSIISSRVVQLNTEYTNAQSDRVKKEAAMEAVRGGALEAAQASSQGEGLRRLGERLNDAEIRFTEVQSHYGVNHPEYKKASAQMNELKRMIKDATAEIQRRVEVEYQEAVSRERMIQDALAQQKKELDVLNARSVEYQALKREAEANTQLYEELVHRIKEAGINASFQGSSIRIADPARPSSIPVSPNTRLNLLLALLFSSVIGVGSAILLDALDDTIRDPEHVSTLPNVEVIGSLPRVKKWKSQLLNRPADEATAGLLHAGSKLDPASAAYVEAIRTLRNSILLSKLNTRIGSLLMTSAGPGDGKSTIAAYLSVTHARQGHRTLLIDGDLRRPNIHRHFHIPIGSGLTEVLRSETRWQEALTSPPGFPQLDILTSGTIARDTPECMEGQLIKILDEASQDYDLVIIDGPPLLGFAEPLRMATAADAVMVVARAGKTSRKAISAVLYTLVRVRANIAGVVLNAVHNGLSENYRYHDYYGKYYKAAGSE